MTTPTTTMSRKHRRGYTLIEVMMAIGIMTVGAVGIMSLQQAATSANIQAYHLTTANEVTRIWLERLRRDGLSWGAQRTVDGFTINLLSTEYLRSADALVVGDFSDWIALVPPGSTATDSWAFDYRGVDTRSTADWTYCTNVRFARVLSATTTNAVRTDVRTWWNRYATSSNTDYGGSGAFQCAQGAQAAAIDDELVGAGRIKAVYASQIIRPVEVQP
ncbi:MAG: prepilin-type N-terminal cleavage/methylation domain-containing protein [Polyangiales bacterium]|nr:prepilin-type N-terminal cleavage/methylation domain-containing protein [Myxococcales bacterium]